MKKCNGNLRGKSWRLGSILAVLLIFGWALTSYGQNNGQGLINAAKEGNIAKVNVNALLVKGAEVNAKASDGYTALLWASENGHSEVVKALLAKGAEVNAKTNNGATALMAASQNGHSEVVPRGQR